MQESGSTLPSWSLLSLGRLTSNKVAVVPHRECEWEQGAQGISCQEEGGCLVLSHTGRSQSTPERGS